MVLAAAAAAVAARASRCFWSSAPFLMNASKWIRSPASAVVNRTAASSKLNKDKKKRARQAKLFELGKEFILDKLKEIDANTQKMARDKAEGAQDWPS